MIWNASALRSSRGFSVMNMRPLFCAALPTPAPSAIADGRDVRVGLDDRAELLLQLHHLGERDVLRRVGGAEQDAGVLLREEALGDDDEQIDGGGDGGEEDHQGHEAVAQHDVEAALVAVGERGESRARSA